MAQKKYVSLSKLSTFLDKLKNTFSAKDHTHKIAEITDYSIDTALSPTSTNPVQNKVLDAEFDAVSQAMTALELAVDDKLDSSDTITNDEIDEICSGTIATYLNSISSEGVSF